MATARIRGAACVCNCAWLLKKSSVSQGLGRQAQIEEPTQIGEAGRGQMCVDSDTVRREVRILKQFMTVIASDGRFAATIVDLDMRQRSVIGIRHKKGDHVSVRILTEPNKWNRGRTIVPKSYCCQKGR